jgi:murein DD-endopeptidase MepM/ murein hydrolase activator NlpD
MSVDFLKTPGLADPTLSLNWELERLKNKVSSTSESKSEQRLSELKDAAQQFEAMLTGYLLKVMRAAVDKSEEDGESSSFGKDVYQEMFDNEIALHMARTQSLGIADMLYRQLENQVKGEKPSTPDKASDHDADPTPASQIQSGTCIPSAVRISSDFGWRSDPIDRQIRFHHGVDLAASSGTPIRAIQAGQVVYSGKMGNYGNTVIVEHQNGYRSLYAHALENHVQAGDVVSEGQILGLVGNTGRSTGSHLHFELQKDGTKINPLNSIGISQLKGLISSEKPPSST